MPNAVCVCTSFCPSFLAQNRCLRQFCKTVHDMHVCNYFVKRLCSQQQWYHTKIKGVQHKSHGYTNVR